MKEEITIDESTYAHVVEVELVVFRSVAPFSFINFSRSSDRTTKTFLGKFLVIIWIILMGVFMSFHFQRVQER